MIMYGSPRRARIISSKYIQFGPGLARLGLLNQQFRAEGEDSGSVVVHAEDFRPNASIEQRKIRKDIVEFLPES